MQKEGYITELCAIQMKHLKCYIILIVLLTLSTSLFSQDRFSGNVKGAMVRSTKTTNASAKSMSGCGDLKPVTDTSEMALFVIDSLLIPPASREILNYLNFDNIADTRVYQKNDSIAKSYGAMGKNGVVVLSFKPGIKLLPLNEVLIKLLGDTYDRSLKVNLNNRPIKEPYKFYVDPTLAFDAKISSRQSQINGIEIKEKFINVITL